MLDYSPQINDYLKSQMKHLSPEMQKLVQSMTSQQRNQAVQASPQLQQAIQDVEPKNTQYYLDKLQEEAAEIVQAVSKIRRFGSDNHHPLRKTTNLQELVGELEDFLALIAALEADKLFDLSQSQESIKTKFEAIYKS